MDYIVSTKAGPYRFLQCSGRPSSYLITSSLTFVTKFRRKLSMANEHVSTDCRWLRFVDRTLYPTLHLIRCTKWHLLIYLLTCDRQNCRSPFYPSDAIHKHGVCCIPFLKRSLLTTDPLTTCAWCHVRITALERQKLWRCWPANLEQSAT